MVLPALHLFYKRFERWTQSPAGLALLEASLIGCMSGISAVLLRQAIGWLGGWRVALSHQSPAGLALPVIGLLGGLLSGWLIEMWAPDRLGSGILQVKATLVNAAAPLTLRTILTKFVSTIIALGSGLALGRQAPTIEIGSALAAQVSRIFPFIPRHKNQLVAAGASSGFAAAFNTPLAGTLFVLEILLRNFSSLTLGTAILAGFFGAVVARLLGAPGLGDELIATGATIQFFPSEIPFYTILGIGSGLLGATFNQAIITSLHLNQRILQQCFRLSFPWRVGLVGLVTGSVMMLLPPLFRDYTGLRILLTESGGDWRIALVAFATLFILTPIAYGANAPGGIFGPSLILGASLGRFVGVGAQSLIGIDSSVSYALVGMGTFFCATTRAPITAIAIVFEMTANFNLILPLMIGVGIAYFVSETASPGSLYDRLEIQKGMRLEAEAMTVKLTTGQEISLKKDSTGLTVLLYGLGWGSIRGNGLKRLFQSDFDLDIAVICLNRSGKLERASDVVYYGNPNHPSGAITHLGDNVTGEGEGDNEQILINLSQIPPEIHHLTFVVNIYQCNPRRQNFGQIDNAFVRLIDMERGSEIACYDLSNDEYRERTGIIVADVCYQSGEWEAKCIGEGLEIRSLQELVDRYFT